MAWVSITQLAEQTSFAVRTLQYIRRQEPAVLVTRQRGGRVEYKQPDCAANLLRRERELVRRDARPASLEEAKTRRETAEAELAELKLAERRAELMTVAEYERVVGDAFSRIRAQLIALERKLAPEAVGIGTAEEAAALIREHVGAVLEELHRADDVPVAEELSRDADDGVGDADGE